MTNITSLEFSGHELTNHHPFKMAFDLSRPTNRLIYYFIAQNSVCDIPMTTILTRFLSPGDTFIDIGSHIGYYSLMARPWVGETGHIYLFEANPDTYGVLLSSIQMNAYRNMTAFNCAVSDQEKVVEFSICDHDEGQSSIADVGDQKISVFSTTLDAVHQRLQFSQVRVVKIDVEGFESAVIHGGHDFFSTVLPENIVFEVNNRIPGIKPHQDQPLRAYFANLGYQSYLIKPMHRNENIDNLFGEGLLLGLPVDKYIGGLEFGNILATRRKIDAPVLPD